MITINNTGSIIKYLKNDCKDIKQHTCIGCGFIKLYDRTGNSYTVRFSLSTIDSVKELVEAIRNGTKEVLEKHRPKKFADVKRHIVYVNDRSQLNKQL